MRPFVDIHVLQCGQGDMILLKLGGKKWVLVDCNLPHAGQRTEFFQLAKQLQIRRLDLVCLTHPHEDHYSGLDEVIRYFTSDGRSVGTFCDSGVEPKQIAVLMRRRGSVKSAVTEFERLYRRIYNLIDAKQIRYFMANENSSPLIEVGDRIQILPVGPRPDVLSQATREVVSLGNIRKDLNRISVVLALSVRGDTKCFDALLTADTDSDGCNSALARCSAVRSKANPSRGFDMVKVPHHGSADSHLGSEIISHRKEAEDSLAVISAGSFDVLPDREVMGDFLQGGWTVLLTKKRSARVTQFAVELSSRSKQTFGVQCQDIQILWRESIGTKWEPAGARVHTGELSNYDSVRD
jgi:beta-lactamase superfamily II metal-dependent hydrolase